MGLYDRDYVRRDAPPSSGPASWSITTWLIGINAVVFVVDRLMLRAQGPATIELPEGLLIMPPLEAMGHFSYALGIRGLQLWRFLTFQFLHAGMWHLLVNMLSLYFFGPMIEERLGRWPFAAFYLLCGLGGAAMYLLLGALEVLVRSPASPLVGASAGVFGVVIAAALTAPNAPVTLWMFPMRLRTLAWATLGVALVTVLTDGRNAGGQAAHLGGAAVGALLIFRAHWLGAFDLKRRVRRQTQAGAWEKKIERRRRDEEAKRAEVDRILAKVKEKGLQSLSRPERETLARDTERMREG